jgi:trk system potassium uptake protein TrkH
VRGPTGCLALGRIRHLDVGPAFGFAGPFGSYAPFTDLSTGILTGLMWLGRLEIIPVAVLLSRTYWRA